jgi:hypothetical protein
MITKILRLCPFESSEKIFICLLFYVTKISMNFKFFYHFLFFANRIKNFIFKIIEY